MRIEVESDHWYTPEWFLESLREDLFFDVEHAVSPRPLFDPCTCPAAMDTLINTSIVKPAPMWDFLSVDIDEVREVAEDDPWFMNPPYSRDVGTAGVFTYRLLEVYPKQWAVLVNASVETQWFQRMLIESDYLVLWPRRLKFDRVVDGVRVPGGQPRYSNALFINGVDPHNAAMFAEKHGLILMSKQ